MSRFLAHYNAYVAKITDAPHDYIQTGGLMLLSSIALGRRRLNRGDGGIHPNLYALLMADSSRDRKSTAVDIAVKILNQVEPERVGPDDFTGEGLLSLMRVRSPYKGKPVKSRNKLMLPLPEFGVTLAQTRAYAATLTAILCKVYDGSSFERARSKGPAIRVDNPRVSMFGGCAFAMLEQYGEPMDWTNGFFARCLFVTPQSRRPRYQTQPVRAKSDFDQICLYLSDLRDDIKKNPGKMDLLPSAVTIYEQFAAQLPENEQDIVRTAQRERLLSTTLKLATLYQIDLQPTLQAGKPALVGPVAMEAATGFAMRCWQAFELVYERASGTPRGKIIKRIWRMLSDVGPTGMERREIYKKLHLSLEEFLPAVELIEACGVVTKHLDPGGQLRYIIKDPIKA